MWPIVLASLLSFTAPLFNQLPDTSCGVENLAYPLGDLARVTLYGVRQGRRTVQVLAQKPEFLGGWRDSLIFPDSGAVWTCWVTFTDRSGNESCPSNLVGVNLTLGVPQGGAAATNWTIYDALGRRVGTLRGDTQAQAVTAVKNLRPGFYRLVSQDGKHSVRVTVIR